MLPHPIKTHAVAAEYSVLCTPTTLHENVIIINVNSSWAIKRYTKVQVKVISSAVSWRLTFHATRVESDFLAPTAGLRDQYNQVIILAIGRSDAGNSSRWICRTDAQPCYRMMIKLHRRKINACPLRLTSFNTQRHRSARESERTRSVEE